MVQGGERIVYQGRAEQGQWPAEVAWFPDGRRLAVGVEHIPMNEEQQEMPPGLWVVDIEKNETRRLADNVRRPEISPNGRWIAYQQPTGEEYETLVTVLDAEDGSEVWTCQMLICLLYTSPSPRDRQRSRMPSSA